MVTTKKVAKSSVSKKAAKKAVRKKVATKKSTKKATSKSTKKGSPKKTKKTVSKKATKKTAAKTSKKAAPKKTSAKASKSFTQKLEKLEAIHKKTSVTKENIPAKRARLQLATLSPYRFPMKVDSFVTQTARFAGVFFVMMGALFTFANLSLVSGDDHAFALLEGGSHTAAVCDSTDPNYNPDDSSCSTTTSVEEKNTSTTMSEPVTEVAAGEPLSGSVPVQVTVAGAKDVRLLIYNSNNNDEKTYSASRVSSDIWKLEWRTDDMVDGYYLLDTIVEYENGQRKIFNGTKKYQVENNPAIIEDTVDQTVNTVDETTDTVLADDTKEESVTSAESVEILSFVKDKQNPVAGKVRFELEAIHVEDIKVVARNIDTNREKFLGYPYAEKAGSNIWLLSYDTTNMDDGEYRVIAQATGVNGGDDVLRMEMVVDNSTTEGEASALTETVDKTEEVVDETTETIEGETNVKEEENILDPAKLKQDIDISVLQSSPISGLLEVRVDVENVSFVELYAKPRLSIQDKFLGLAKKVDEGRWLFRADSAEKLPNGEYEIFARSKNEYGLFRSEAETVLVYNEVKSENTDEQKRIVEDLSSIEVENESYVETDEEELSDESDDNLTTDDTEADDVIEDEKSTSTQSLESNIDEILRENKDRLDDEFARLAAAIRNGDEDAIERIKARINDIKEEIITVRAGEEGDDFVVELDERLQETIKRVERDVEKTEKIVRERTGESITKDSDQDGITDFDEINIFETDPFVADTDNDGFNDGAEILGGYNPKDDTPEALVKYESPKETGVVREDILVVEEIVTTKPKEGDNDGVEEEAVIFGKALPNSFVTLYIFSTPVVVTVKTDSDGSWQYRFDKELEDGEHEVYVGVTDNAGKIIAKSNPYRFVKQAEAFTPVDASEETPVLQTSDDSSLGTGPILIIMSISVVTVGVLLILIGLHMDTANTRRKPFNEEIKTT